MGAKTFGGKMVWGHNIHIAKGIIDDESYPYLWGSFEERLDNNYVTIGSNNYGEFHLIQ